MLAALAAPSCVSLDSKPDVQKAEANVQDRTGYVVPWNEPWAKDMAWDGEAPLTVDVAVLAALANNGEIRALVEQVSASRADLAQAGLLPNPVVSISVRVPLDGGPVISPVGVSVTQSFVALWLRGPRMRAADARLNQSILTLSNSALELVAKVKAAHARIVFGQRGLELQDASIARARGVLESLRQHPDQEAELEQARIEQLLLVAESDRTRLCMQLARRKRELLRLMGRADSGDEWTAKDASNEEGFDSHPPLLPRDFSEEDARALALLQRLDVAASLAVVEANKKDLNVEERNRIRDLGIGVVVQQTQDELRSLGLQNSIPLFDFNQARIAKAGSLGRAALATAEATFQRAIMEARVAHGDAFASRDVAAQYRNGALPLARRNFERSLVAIGEDSIDRRVLCETLATLASSEQTANDLELEAAIAGIELERAVGGSLRPIATPATMERAEPGKETGPDAESP